VIGQSTPSSFHFIISPFQAFSGYALDTRHIYYSEYVWCPITPRLKSTSLRNSPPKTFEITHTSRICGWIPIRITWFTAPQLSDSNAPSLAPFGRNLSELWAAKKLIVKFRIFKKIRAAPYVPQMAVTNLTSLINHTNLPCGNYIDRGRG